MRHRLIHALPSWLRDLLSIVVLLTGGGVLATNPKTSSASGLRFVGHYHVTLIAEYADHVTVDFSLRLFNYSGERIAGGTVSVTDRWLSEATFGQFTAIDLDDGQELLLTGLLTVPTHDYRLWTDGLSPLAHLEHVGLDGLPRHEPIELIPSLMVEGVMP